MRDERLSRAWQGLEPTGSQRARVETRVVEAWAARPRSLLVEWLDVLRARPLLNGAWALAAMAVVLVTTPVGGLLSALPRLQGVALTRRHATLVPGRMVARVPRPSSWGASTGSPELRHAHWSVTLDEHPVRQQAYPEEPRAVASGVWLEREGR